MNRCSGTAVLASRAISSHLCDEDGASAGLRFSHAFECSAARGMRSKERTHERDNRHFGFDHDPRHG
jgi:hypothetical protein